MLRGMVAKFIVGENSSRHHIGSHVKSSIFDDSPYPSQIDHDVAVRLRAADQHIAVGGCVQRIGLISRSSLPRIRYHRCGRPRFDMPTAQARRKPRRAQASCGTLASTAQSRTVRANETSAPECPTALTERSVTPSVQILVRPLAEPRSNAPHPNTSGPVPGTPHSSPMWAPFSATERFISSTASSGTSVTTANKKKTSK